MMAEVTLERNEMQKIRSYGEEHHEGPALGRTPDDDDDQQDSQREISYCVQDILIYSVMLTCVLMLPPEIDIHLSIRMLNTFQTQE